MAYCGPKGIPHSVFLDWEPLDREKAIAWSVRERTRCGGCGVPAGEGGEFAPEEYICEGCEALESLDSKDSKAFKGVRKRLVPKGFFVDDD